MAALRSVTDEATVAAWHHNHARRTRDNYTCSICHRDRDHCVCVDDHNTEYAPSEGAAE